MSLLSDSLALYQREMIIFRANIRANLVRAAIFPLFILIVFGSTGGAITNVPVVVVNYANNMQSQQFINSLGSESIMSVQTVTDQNDALNQLEDGKISFVVVILPNFPSTGNPAIQVYYSNTQYAETSEILPIIQQRAEQFTSPGSYQAQEYLPDGTLGPVITTPINGANGSQTDFIFSGIIGMVLVFTALFGGGMGLITDRTSGNIKAFLVTPINKASILIARIMSGAVQSLLYILIVLLIGIVIFGATIAMGLIGLVWIFALGMLLMICFTSLSAMLASRIKNVTNFAIFSQAIGLPLWFLAGGIVPVSSLPSFLQTASLFDPMSYAIDGFRWVVLVGTYPLPNIILDFSVLIVFAIITTVLSVFLFKSTIE